MNKLIQNLILKNNINEIQKTSQENQVIEELKRKDFNKEDLTSYLKEIEKAISGFN